MSTKASHSCVESKCIIYHKLTLEQCIGLKWDQHSLIIETIPAGSTLHCTLLAPNCNSRYYFQEKRPTLGCPGQGKHVLLSRSRRFQHDKKDLKNPALHIILSSLDRVSLAYLVGVFSLFMGVHIVYHSYDMQELQSQESYRSVKYLNIYF